MKKLLERYKNNRIICTSYINPDLDGFACAMGMFEYLNKLGFNSIVGLRGKPHAEAQFVINFLTLSIPDQLGDIFQKSDKIFLLDASQIHFVLDDKIKIDNIVGVIDHRKVNDGDKFINAEVQIELVGSAATLVAEKFFENKFTPSKNTAVLLYSAIVSNTINFKNNVTTNRDIKMANWLLSLVNLPKDYITKMFLYKTNQVTDLYQRIMSDYSTSLVGEHNLGIMQLELVGVSDFIRLNLDEILTVLKRIKKENNLYSIFLTCIDVIDGYNIFVSSDKISQDLLNELYGIKFNDCIAKREVIIMRKEIIADLQNVKLK